MNGYILAFGLEGPRAQSVDSIALGSVSTHGTRVSDRAKLLMSRQVSLTKKIRERWGSLNSSLKDTSRT